MHTDPWSVESTDAEPMETEGRLYKINAMIHYQYFGLTNQLCFKEIEIRKNVYIYPCNSHS